MSHIREPVPGAPFQPGDKVMVIDNCDETANHKRLGSIGIVDCLYYDGGCGESYPSDPMIGVKFGKRKVAVDEFWAEELEAVS